MALTLRATKGTPLTHGEMDTNFSELANGQAWNNPVAPGSLTVTSTLNVGGRVFITNQTNTDPSAILQLGTGDTQATTRTAIAFRSGGFASVSVANSTSNGDKLILWNQGTLKLAIGIEGGGLWFQNNGSATSGGFRFYGGSGATSALELVIATNIASQANYWVLHGRASGAQPCLGVNGADAAIAAAYITKGSAGHQFFTGGSWNSDNVLTGGVEQVRIGHIASAVNFLVIQGAVAGGSVVITADGTSAQIPIRYRTKGTDGHVFETNSTQDTIQFFISHTASSVNYINVTGAALGNSPVLSLAGSDTNINLTISAKGSGNIILSPSTGDIRWNKANVALGAGGAATLGATGGSGPAATAQRNWLRYLESDGTASFIPTFR